MKTRKVALARGTSAGLGAGALWWATEWAANWAMGGTPSAWALGAILGLDLAVGVVGGVLLGLLTGATSIPVLALGLTAVFGFLRIFEPPGVRSELLYFALAPVCVAFGVRLAGRERRGAIAFVQLTVIGVAAIVFGKALITDEMSYFAPTEPNALVLVGLLLGLPLAGIAVDRLLGLVVRREAPRLALELAAGALVLAVLGEAALHRGPRRPAVARAPPREGRPDVILVSLDTTRADHMSTYGYARDTSPDLPPSPPMRSTSRKRALRAQWTVPGACLDVDRHVSESSWRATRGRGSRGPQVYGRRRVFPLAEDRVTMAELLRERG